MLFSSKNYHFKFPLVASKVSPKSSKTAISMITPKALPKAVSSKFLTKQPISVPTSHLVVSFSLYIFWYCLFLVIAISAIFMLFSSQNYHFKFPLVASKVPLKSSNKAVSMIPPKEVLKAVFSNFFTKQTSPVPISHLVVSFSLYIFGIVCSW